MSTRTSRDDGSAAGYSAGRTLPLRVEALRQLSRPRTRWTFAVLAVLPLLLAVAFRLGPGDGGGGDPGGGSAAGGGSALVDLATGGAADFTVFTLLVASSLLLVVVVALFCGDAVASESSWGSLRYLLAQPVPRARLLRQKLTVALASSALGVVGLPVVAFVVGGLFFGWEPLTALVGEPLTPAQSLWRLAVVVVYLLVTLLPVAALATFLSVRTDAPLGAVGGAVAVVVVSAILDAVTALGALRAVLPTHYSAAWQDALGPVLAWDQMARGALSSVAYTSVLLALAWRHLASKDVTS